MSYEILKVANGFMVKPPFDVRGETRNADSIHVFETWERAAEWLREQFSKK